MKLLAILFFAFISFSSANAQEFDFKKEIGVIPGEHIDSAIKHWSAKGAKCILTGESRATGSKEYTITNTGDVLGAQPDKIKVSSHDDGQTYYVSVYYPFTGAGGLAYKYLDTMLPVKNLDEKGWLAGDYEIKWFHEGEQFIVAFMKDVKKIFLRQLEAENQKKKSKKKK